GLACVVVQHVVPAVHQDAGDGVLVTERVLGVQSVVVVRDGIGKKQAARVVEVVLGLYDFGSMWRDELSRVDLQALANRSEIREKGFFQVLIKAQASGIRTIDGVHRLPEAEGNVVAGS